MWMILEEIYMAKFPYYIEVYDLIEFSRLVCALERIPRTSFSFDFDKRNVISVQMDVLKERPVNYYVQTDKTGHYLSYELKAGKENCDIVNTITNPTYLYSPIVRVKSLPNTLKPETNMDKDVMYESLELEDITSLIKLNDLDENRVDKLESRTMTNIKNLNKYLCAIKLNFHVILPLGKKSLEKINQAAHDVGLQTIADIKLNDIGNTNKIAVERLWECGF